MRDHHSTHRSGDASLDDDKVTAGDTVLENESLGESGGIALETLDGEGVQSGDGLGEDVAGTGDAARELSATSQDDDAQTRRF